MKPRYFNTTSSLRSAMLLLLSATCISLSATAVSDTLVTVKNAHEVTVKADSTNVEINIKGAGDDPTYAYHFLRSTDKAVVENRQGRDHNISKGVGMMNVITLKPVDVVHTVFMTHFKYSPELFKEKLSDNFKGGKSPPKLSFRRSCNL